MTSLIAFLSGVSAQTTRSKAFSVGQSAIQSTFSCCPAEVPKLMKDACRYAERSFSLLARYIMVRPVAHAAIVMAVLGAVGCSVGAQYGVKVLQR